MKNKNIKFLGIFLVGLVAVSMFSGCIGGDKENNEGERMPVEAELSIPSALYKNANQRPIIYGVQSGEPFTVEFTAEKFMGNLDGELNMQMFLPEELQIVEGNTSWVGTDKFKTISVRVIAVKEGRYELSATATNLDTKFNTTTLMIVCVESDLEKLKECVGVSK